MASRRPSWPAKLGLPQGRGGRLTVEPDLTVDGFPQVYAIGDIANIPDHDGDDLPQLGSVALQAGRWAAENILADHAGKPRQPFHYKDKGIMAMIGDGAAIAEMGAHHHELHGHVALRRLARRARLADERRAPARRRLHVVGVGLPRLEPVQLDHRLDDGPIDTDDRLDDEPRRGLRA